jgi:hypothetical protein
MIMKSQLAFRNTECLVPFHAHLLPVLIPFFFLTRPHKELHLHLLKFRILKINCLATISFLNALPICAIPNGTFCRADFCTLRKLTKIPWAVSGLKINVAGVISY